MSHDPIPADDLTPCPYCRDGKRHPLEEMVLFGPERHGKLVFKGEAKAARVSYEVVPHQTEGPDPVPYIELLLVCEAADLELGTMLAGEAVRKMGEYLIRWADKHKETAP